LNPRAVQNRESVTLFFQKPTVKSSKRTTKNPQKRTYWIHLRRLSWKQHKRQGQRTPLHTHLLFIRRHTQQYVCTTQL